MSSRDDSASSSSSAIPMTTAAPTAVAATTAASGSFTTKARKAYAPKACLECRRHKIRCLGNGDVACQRCVRMTLDCLYPERKRSVPTKRLLNNRVQHLEQHVEKIESLIKSRRRLSSANSTTNGDHNLDPPDPNLSHRPRTSNTITSPSESEINSHDTATSHSVSSRDPPDVIDKGILTVAEAEELLCKWQDLALSFPYVVIRPDTSLETLRDESPMMLHAVLVNCARSDSALRKKLVGEYLVTLNIYTIVEGRQDLDLLQSIMLYLAWVHFDLEPRKKIVYRLSALAVGLLHELDICTKPKRRYDECRVSVDMLLANDSHLKPLSADFWSLAAMRALVGCYIMTTLFSIIGRKPPLLQYTDYMLDCANVLANEGIESDKSIPLRLELVRLAEQVCETFMYQSPLGHEKKLNQSFIQTYHSIFQARLDAWNTKYQLYLSQKREGPRNLRFAYFAIGTLFREVALDFSINEAPTMAQTKMLTECLSYIRHYLDGMLELPLHDIFDWTCLEWGWFTYAMMLLNHILTHHQSDTWNAALLRPIIKLEEYMDSVCCRLRNLPGSADTAWYEFLYNFLQGLKARYLAILKAREDERALVQAQSSVNQQQSRVGEENGPQRQFGDSATATYASDSTIQASMQSYTDPLLVPWQYQFPFPMDAYLPANFDIPAFPETMVPAHNFFFPSSGM